MARPDFSQMVPYKPKFIWYPGEHRMPGGEFPFPPAVADLCQFMPPPASFQGPFVMVDRLMDVFAKMQLPDNFYGKEQYEEASMRFAFLVALKVSSISRPMSYFSYLSSTGLFLRSVTWVGWT